MWPDEIIKKIDWLQENRGFAGSEWQQKILEAIYELCSIADNANYDVYAAPDKTIENISRILRDAINMRMGRIEIAADDAVKAVLRRLSIQYDLSTSMAKHVWVERSVADAIKLYRQNGGYADLTLLKFLGKLRQVPKSEEKEQSPPGQTAFSRKLKKRVPINIEEAYEDRISKYNRRNRRAKSDSLKYHLGKYGRN